MKVPVIPGLPLWNEKGGIRLLSDSLPSGGQVQHGGGMVSPLLPYHLLFR
jgi:hypothetical protein